MATTGYAKLASSIVTSSIWVEDHPTFKVWIGMLAMADKDGVVEGSVPGFASLCQVTREEMETALAKFLAPDPDSRNQTHEGRRIKVCDLPTRGGWIVLNYENFRDNRNTDRREYQRQKQSQYRRQKREDREREGALAAQGVIRGAEAAG